MSSEVLQEPLSQNRVHQIRTQVTVALTFYIVVLSLQVFLPVIYGFMDDGGSWKSGRFLPMCRKRCGKSTKAVLNDIFYLFYLIHRALMCL